MSLILSFSFCMSTGLEKSWFRRRPCLLKDVQGPNFRLFLWVQAFLKVSGLYSAVIEAFAWWAWPVCDL